MAAAEPNVNDPIDMAWDEDGRLFVCEIWNYPGEIKKGDSLGRIRLLESTRDDGYYDKSTVYADKVQWPGGVIPWKGGIFVISSPDVWYFKDTTGSGKADVRQKVFSGFQGRTYEIANSLRWGMDNRIYISGSYAGGALKREPEAGAESSEGEPDRLRIFSFDPASLAV